MPDMTASCGTPFDFISFLGYFHILLLMAIHVSIVVSPSQFHRSYVRLIPTICYVNMADVTSGYGRLSDLSGF